MKVRKKAAKTPIGQVKSLSTAFFKSGLKGKKKLAVLGIILYIISPFDLVPDFIPLAGYADDLLLPVLYFIAQYLMNDESEEMPKHKIKEAEKVS